jgi:hypothetical protein
MTVLTLQHVPHTCHWSVPTLFMPRPYWLSATDADWCCWNDRQIVVLESSETCKSCPQWTARQFDVGLAAMSPRPGAMPLRLP